MKRLKQKGLSIIEALIATALIGIGFIAIFQMVNFSVNSINTSGERTKANFLTTMVAEGIIGYRDTIGGLKKEDQNKIYYKDGKAYIVADADDPGGEGDTECKKFAEYYMALAAGKKPSCTPGGSVELEMTDESDNQWTNVTSGSANIEEQKVQIKKCPDKFSETASVKPIHGDNAQKFEDAPRNKIVKWIRLLGEDRSVRCKSEKDFKTVDMFELCIWANDPGVKNTRACQISNSNVYDEAMYIGRIQINLNNGKKRKFLYFQADYKTKQGGSPSPVADEDEDGEGL